jgi:hypothetical protein
VGDLPIERRVIHQELDRAIATFHALTASASTTDLRRKTTGTRWTNRQMLFHMLFGYLIVHRLLRLVRLFGRLPDRFSWLFAGTLNSATRPFHVINYLGSCGGALIFLGPRLTRQFNHTVDSLHRHLGAESDDALARSMHFPLRWDPFFRDRITLAEVYHYGTEHFDFHREQLTL